MLFIVNVLLPPLYVCRQDRDLSDASCHLAELSAKLQHADSQVEEGREAERALKRQVTGWRNKCEEARRDMEHLKRQWAHLIQGPIFTVIY